MIAHVQDALSVGGPALWVIFGLSIVLVTVGLWKFWHFSNQKIQKGRN